MPEYFQKEVLITVKAYPNPSGSFGESNCVVGIDREGKLVRLYPIPLRQLDDDKQFRKYQWVRLKVNTPKNDPRQETFRPDLNTICPIGEVLPTKNSWAARRIVIEPCVSRSMCYIQEEQIRSGLSLGVFKPKKVLDFNWEPESSEWSPQELGKIMQSDLFMTSAKEPLEKIPFTFRYKYTCEDCRSGQFHHMKIVDWELIQFFRKMRRNCATLADCLKTVRSKWLDDIASDKNDLYFFTGNMLAHPNAFLILGVFWPRKGYQPGLFNSQ